MKLWLLLALLPSSLFCSRRKSGTDSSPSSQGSWRRLDRRLDLLLALEALGRERPAQLPQPLPETPGAGLAQANSNVSAADLVCCFFYRLGVEGCPVYELNPAPAGRSSASWSVQVFTQTNDCFCLRLRTVPWGSWT